MTRIPFSLRQVWQKPWLFSWIACSVAVLLIGLYACEQQPYRMGERLYKVHCANCHLDQGEGLGALIPPLANSDYLPANRDRLACIVRYGLKDTIVVNGKMYAEEMVANNMLSDIQITNLVNFVLQKWGNQQTPLTFEAVQASLAQCKQ